GQSLWPRGQSPVAGFPAVWVQPDGQAVMQSSQPGEYTLEISQRATTKVTLAPPPPAVELRGAWRVSFVGVTPPQPQVFEQLIAWNKHPDSAVRFFSGAGEHRQEITLDAKAAGGDTRTYLDLGEVRELAEVALNGAPLGVVWKPPFRLDVTGKLRAGRNEISIRVINTWANRLIGDAALPEAERHTWISFKHYDKTDELPDSGLLGPVRIQFVEQTVLK
ncbi:MAG: hypothetical protein NTZ16_01145, partial [Verrucomicrobia bacterium]|nr:hypothetical protein [Verrucomicrobiota bacterium]